MNGKKNKTGYKSGVKYINYTSNLYLKILEIILRYVYILLNIPYLTKLGGSHAKNLIFKTIINNQPMHYIITGSANLKVTTFKTKANNQLLLKSSSSELYDLFKDAFYNYYNYPSRTHIHSNVK